MIDWAPAEYEGDKIIYVFDGGHLNDDDLRRIALDSDEITEFRYVDGVDLDDLASPRLASRVRMATEAKQGGRMIYAEQGEEVPAGRRL